MVKLDKSDDFRAILNESGLVTFEAKDIVKSVKVDPLRFNGNFRPIVTRNWFTNCIQQDLTLNSRPTSYVEIQNKIKVLYTLKKHCFSNVEICTKHRALLHCKSSESNPHQWLFKKENIFYLDSRWKGDLSVYPNYTGHRWNGGHFRHGPIRFVSGRRQTSAKSRGGRKSNAFQRSFATERKQSHGCSSFVSRQLCSGLTESSSVRHR